MPGCAVANCKNHSRKTKGTEVRYFRFPNNEDLAKQWITACRRKDNFNIETARVCSNHFAKGCLEIPLKHKLFQYSPKNYRSLKSDAVPTINIPEDPQKKENEERLIKAAKRSIRMKVETILSSASTSEIIKLNEILSKFTDENE